MQKSVVLVLLVVLMVAGVAEASTSAWVWANSPAAASYAPQATYAYNPACGPITINRSAVGTYSVRFTNLISIAGTGGNVQVTPYGPGTSDCRVQNWTTSGNDLLINVRCYTTAGASADSTYTVLYTFN